VIGTRDVITFAGRSVEEIRREFHKSVDVYLNFCQERGKEPDKPFSGQFMLRITPDLHRKLYTLAAHAGQSLNAWVTHGLEALVEHAQESVGRRATAPATPRSKRQPARKGRSR
jgi:predicted HicB family RNase H-like nuclease